ncbi:MAG: tetratricopeptide repeat protein [Myxococcota bacterium]
MARRLFEEGIEFGEAERWEEAVDRFSRAYELRPSPGIAVNLASALIPLGELVEASELLQGLIDSSETPDNVRELATTLMSEEVEGNLASLIVNVRTTAEDVEIYLDDNLLPEAVWGVAVPADPGTSLVEAFVAGEPVESETVEIEAGGSAELTLEVEAPPVEEVREPPPPDPTPTSSGTPVTETWWFWTGLGVIAAAGVAVVLALVLGSSTADPIAGNTNPPFLEGMVMP